MHFVYQNKQGYRAKLVLTSRYMAQVYVQMLGYKIKEADPSFNGVEFDVEMSNISDNHTTSSRMSLARK